MHTRCSGPPEECTGVLEGYWRVLVDGQRSRIVAKSKEEQSVGETVWGEKVQDEAFEKRHAESGAREEANQFRMGGLIGIAFELLAPLLQPAPGYPEGYPEAASGYIGKFERLEMALRRRAERI